MSLLRGVARLLALPFQFAVGLVIVLGMAVSVGLAIVAGLAQGLWEHARGGR